MQEQKEGEEMFTEVSDCRVKIPEDLLDSIDYGEYSEVIAVGQVWSFIGRDKNRITGMTAYGLFPLSKVKTEEKSEPVNEPDANNENSKEFAEFNDAEDETLR